MKQQTYRVRIVEKTTREYEVIAESPEDAELMAWGDLPSKSCEIINEENDLVGVGVAQVVVPELNFLSSCYTKEYRTIVLPDVLHKKALHYLGKSLEQNLAEKLDIKKTKI